MPNILRLRPVTVMRCGVAWGLGTRLARARYIGECACSMHPDSGERGSDAVPKSRDYDGDFGIMARSVNDDHDDAVTIIDGRQPCRREQK